MKRGPVAGPTPSVGVMKLPDGLDAVRKIGPGPGIPEVLERLGLPETTAGRLLDVGARRPIGPNGWLSAENPRYWSPDLDVVVLSNRPPAPSVARVRFDAPAAGRHVIVVRAFNGEIKVVGPWGTVVASRDRRGDVIGSVVFDVSDRRQVDAQVHPLGPDVALLGVEVHRLN